MTVMDIELAEQTAAGWRTTEGPGNPAGPLYASGIFAEPDIMEGEGIYSHGATACTVFNGHPCC